MTKGAGEQLNIDQEQLIVCPPKCLAVAIIMFLGLHLVHIYIEAVRSFPRLWEISSKDYKDSRARNNAWKSVAEQVGGTPDQEI